MEAVPADDVPISLSGVVKRYGGRTVLDQVTLDVVPGITGLVGPNGAGKSTLVRAILGLLHLAAGRVRVLGLDPARDPRRVRQLVGVVPEDDCSVPGLSGIQMVHYAARLSGLPSREGLRRSHEVLDWCDAGQERYRPVETLSVGTRQKLAFAAAIVHDPRIVILDEPTNGLDPLERRAMLGRLVTLARDHGKTVLVSTHVLRDVQAVCDHMVVLSGGRIRLAAPIADLTQGGSSTLRLQGYGPLATLAEALRAQGMAAEVAGGEGPDERMILIDRSAQHRLRTVWACARDAGVAVQTLGPETRRLEDVFLAALEGSPAVAERASDAAS